MYVYLLMLPLFAWFELQTCSDIFQVYFSQLHPRLDDVWLTEGD